MSRSLSTEVEMLMAVFLVTALECPAAVSSIISETESFHCDFIARTKVIYQYHRKVDSFQKGSGSRVRGQEERRS